MASDAKKKLQHFYDSFHTMDLSMLVN